MTETMNGPSDGGKYIDRIDPEDPEYVRQMRRPAEVKEDIKQMEQRKRVDLIMQTQAYREELEQIVHDQLKAGPHPASLLALQQISELLPQYRFNQSSVFSKSSASVIPVADIRGCDTLNYTKGEKILRCKLASCCRLIDMHGWSNGLRNNITARINQENEHFLANPHGMLYHEVTASSLVKANAQGEIVDSGTTSLGISKPGYSLHAAIHTARPDVKAIIHLNAPQANAVSSMQSGLLPVSQEAILCGEASYFDFKGAVGDSDESDRLARALGPRNKILVLRNGGILACGESIEEAFFLATNIVSACDTQLKTIPAGLDNLHMPSEEDRKQMYEIANASGSGGDSTEGKRKWRRGEIEFEAFMRHLDNSGFRSGYIYHEPVLRSDRRRLDRANSEVEIPPTATSFSDNWDGEGPAPYKYYMDRHKKAFKSEWLNSPNAYKKEEFEETGTPNPKKITKWLPESSPNKTSTPIKLDTANQFAPQGSNPKELRSKHKEIRKDYYEERVHAGPQSRILEGMTWEEAQAAKDGHVSGTTDSVIVVGAASKGIIQRDHQHNVSAYKTYYAPNPFDNMSEDEIEKYKSDIERKARGESAGDTTEDEGLVPGPDGRLISTQERMEQVKTQHEVNGVEQRSSIDETEIGVIRMNPHMVVAPAHATAVEPVQRPVPAPRKSTSSSRSSASSITGPDPPSPTTPQDFHRSASARYSPQKSVDLVQELNQNFNRSKSERKPSKTKRMAGGVETEINGAGSPTKSASSGDGLGTSSQEGSPTKEMPAAHDSDSPSKGDKKKKKFRMPSFSKQKKEKK